MAKPTFDTHEFVQELKSAGFANGQAEAIVKAQAHLLSAALETRDVQVATKSDIAELMSQIERTQRDMADIKAATITWIAGLLLVQAVVVTALVKLVQPT